MQPITLETLRLKLVAQTTEQALAKLEAMDASQRAAVSADWLQRLELIQAEERVWTLGFSIVRRDPGQVVGQCGFKGPPGANGVVEMAYFIEPGHTGNGFATEAARALVNFAFLSGRVTVVRAHTLRERNASTRILNKCGFQFLGEVTEPEDGLVWRWEKHKSAP